MTEEVTKQKVIIDEVEYLVEDMTEEQIMLVNHVADLDRKINSARFNLDQLSGGREYFMAVLKNKLAEPAEEQEVA